MTCQTAPRSWKPACTLPVLLRLARVQEPRTDSLCAHDTVMYVRPFRKDVSLRAISCCADGAWRPGSPPSHFGHSPCRHDFTVVETIDFYQDEDAELPPPMTQRDVITLNKAGLEDVEPAAEENGDASKNGKVCFDFLSQAVWGRVSALAVQGRRGSHERAAPTS